MSAEPLVFDERRQCYRADGQPKAAFPTFDLAFEQVASAVGHRADRTHVYKCPNGHGYHLARNRLSNGSGARNSRVESDQGGERVDRL